MDNENHSRRNLIVISITGLLLLFEIAELSSEITFGIAGLKIKK